MRKIDEYIKGRAQELDLERGNQLALIQEALNRLYPGKVRAKRLKDGELTLTTPSAAVAGDLRLRQEKIKQKLETYKIKSIKIQIS